MRQPDALRCVGLDLGYAGATPVLRGVEMGVAAGEAVALLGPSGSGKTTLLHAVAGFVAPAAGEIWLSGRRVSTARSSTPPERRRVGMVFQHYALWPHMPAVDTVAYPMRRRGMRRTAARARALDLLDRVGIAALADRRPHQLSGGEQQRVGLARALAGEPAIYLFDEPSAHLDAHLRASVRQELDRHRAATGAAAVYATHDTTEALSLADQVAVVHGGRLAQIGTPEQVYAEPVDATVAALTGTSSVLRGTTHRNPDGAISLRIGPIAAIVPGAGPAAPAAESFLIRPDWASLGGDLPGTVTAVAFQGPASDYHLDTPGGAVVIREAGPPRARVGEAAGWTLHRCWPLPAGAPAAVPEPSGHPVRAPA